MSIPDVSDDQSLNLGMQEPLPDAKEELSPIEQLAIQKLQGKQDGSFEVFFNTRTKNWQVSYIQQKEILTKNLDKEQVAQVQRNHQSILTIVQKTLGLTKGEVLSLEVKKEIASPIKPPYERIPLVNGICIFNDMDYSERTWQESPDASWAFTTRFADACKQNVPIVTSPHLIRNALSDPKYAVTLENLKKNYLFYSNPNRSFIVMIPKLPPNISPRTLCFSDQLKPIPESDLVQGKSEQIFEKAKNAKYADLKAIFSYSQNKTPPRLALFIGGHGSSQSVIDLKDQDYRDFVEHLNRVYSLSACMISSCDPHGVQPRIDGILIQLGTPHLTVGSPNKVKYDRMLEHLNSVDDTSLFAIILEQINKAIACIPQIDIWNQPTLWFDFFVHSGRPRQTPKAINFTYTTMQKMRILQSKGVEDQTIVIPKQKEELRLFVPDASSVNITFEKEVIPILSYVKEKSYHVFDTVTINNSTNVASLDDFVRISLLHEDIVKNAKMRSSTNNLFLFKKIIINNITYENVCVILEKDKPLRFKYMSQDPPLPRGVSSVFQITSVKFLEMVMEGIQLARPSDRAIEESSAGQQTHASIMNSIQNLFFPDKKWVAYLDSPELLQRYLMNSYKEKKLIENSSIDFIANTILDRNYHLSYPELNFMSIIKGTKPDLNIVYANQNQFEADLKEALKLGDEGKKALRRLKLGLSSPNSKVDLNRQMLEKEYYALDHAFINGNVELVKTLLHYGAYSYHQMGFAKSTFTDTTKTISKLLIEHELKNKGKLASSSFDDGVIMSEWNVGQMMRCDAEMPFLEPYIQHALVKKEKLRENLLKNLLERTSSDLLLRLAALIPESSSKTTENKALKSLAYVHVMQPGCSDALVILMNKGWIDPKEALAKAFEAGNCQMIIDIMRSGTIVTEEWNQLPSPLNSKGTVWQLTQDQIIEKFRKLALEKDHAELYKALDQPGKAYLTYRKLGKTEEQFVKHEMKVALKNGCTDIFTYLLKERLVFINPETSIGKILDLAGGLEKVGLGILQVILSSGLSCKDLNLLEKLANQILNDPIYPLYFKNICIQYLKSNLDKLKVNAAQLKELFEKNGWLISALKFDLKELYQFYYDRIEHFELLKADMDKFLQLFKLDFLRSMKLAESGPFIQKKLIEVLKERNIRGDTLLKEIFIWDNRAVRELFPFVLPYCLQDNIKDIRQLLQNMIHEINNERGHEHIKIFVKYTQDEVDDVDDEIFQSVKRLQCMFEILRICKKREVRPSDDLLNQAIELVNLMKDNDAESQDVEKIIEDLRKLPVEVEIVLPEIPVEEAQS